MSISRKVTLYKSCNMLTFNSCGKNASGAESMYKTDSHSILKRILKFPAQPSHFLGTMEKYNICIFDQEIQVFEVCFFVLSNLVLATVLDGLKVGIVLCKSRSILVDL